jgi:hypothetical protein
MKTLLKVFAIILLILLAIIILLPFVFEGKIIEMAKKELNNSVNARVDFDDIDLSLIRNFPNFTIGIDGLTIIGKNEFENDTLAYIDNISITVGLFSVIKGDDYSVKKIVINSPNFNIKILDNGRTNYDIILPDTEPESTQANDESGFNLELKKFIINNGQTVYQDDELGLIATFNDLNVFLSGNLSSDATLITTNFNAESISVDYEGIRYLSDVKFRYKANIDADLQNEIYKLGRNELALNDLLIGFDGSVSMMQEGWNLILTFNAPSNNFKSFLSLVPVVFSKDFENIVTDGKMSIDGSIKGLYSDELLPSFNVNLTIDDAMFQYPDLPKAIQNINTKVNISNPGGKADRTIIDVSTFKMTMGNNPIQASLLIKTPVSDPDINAKIKGEIDLSSVKDYYPLEEKDVLSGAFVADITLNGKLSAIENERFDEFIALGSLLVKDMQYATPSVSHPIKISNAQLNFSPQYLDLVSFKMTTGESDLKASGKIENYLDYVFSDGVLKGSLSVSSDHLNIDQLMSKEADEEIASTEGKEMDETEETGVLEVPKNIDFSLNAEFGKLIYDDLLLENVTGKVIIKKQEINLENLKSNLIGGQMKVNGKYSSANIEKPTFNLAFSLSGIDIQKSYEKFALIRKYLPLAKKTSGKFATYVNLSSTLDKNMMPVFETMNGNGTFNTSKLSIKELNTLIEIAKALYYDELKSMDLEKISLAYQFVNGKLITKPFNIKYKNINAEIEGWTGFDQRIGYLMNMNIPRKELGSGANKLVEELTKEAEKLGLKYELPENIKIGISIGGTLDKPKINTDLKESGSNLVKQAKEELEKQLRKELQAQADKIINEANKQAKAIMDEANRQANILRKNADDAIKKLNTETDKKANVLLEEAKKQGVLAELAAKETVKQLRKEADKQVQSLRNDADKKVDGLLNTAKTKSDKIKQEARKQADELLAK